MAVLTAVTLSEGPLKTCRQEIISMVWSGSHSRCLNLHLSDSVGLAVSFGIANVLLEQ
jgi:hypothetical protein